MVASDVVHRDLRTPLEQLLNNAHVLLGEVLLVERPDVDYITVEDHFFRGYTAQIREQFAGTAAERAQVQITDYQYVDLAFIHLGTQKSSLHIALLFRQC